MELKTYQRQVIADLNRYLELLKETKIIAPPSAFFWQEKGVPTLGIYQDVLPGVPNLCFQGAYWRRENPSCLQRRPSCV